MQIGMGVPMASSKNLPHLHHLHSVSLQFQIKKYLKKASSTSAVSFARRLRKGQTEEVSEVPVRTTIWVTVSLNESRNERKASMGQGAQVGSRYEQCCEALSCAQLAAVPGWSKGVVPPRARCYKPSLCLMDLPWSWGKRVQVGSPGRIRSLSGNNA